MGGTGPGVFVEIAKTEAPCDVVPRRSICRLSSPNPGGINDLFGFATICTEILRDTLEEVDLALAPEGAIILGRAHAVPVPYLHPGLRPTCQIPGSGENLLQGWDNPKDNWVSRAHFMLRYRAGGVLLVNGVPRQDGSLRPPLNGTWLESPEKRWLGNGEEYMIEAGNSASIVLPNQIEIRIAAA